MSTNENWHLQKSVPLTFVFAIFTQAVALVWFFSELKSNIQANEKQVAQHEARIDGLEQLVQGQAVSLARIDENISHIRATVDRVLNEGSSR
jgi:type VI protein secretion system component VasK